VAKFLGSAVVGSVTNKAGGVVFTKNRAGAMLRNKVSGVQPQSDAQRLERSVTQALNNAWHNTLTPNTRHIYNRLAENFPINTSLQNPKPTTGYLLYMRLGRNYYTLFGSVLPFEPPNLDVVQPQLCVLASSGGPTPTLTLSVTPEATAASNPIIFAAGPTSPGRQARKSDYRRILIGSAGQPNPINIKAPYEEKFGALRTGQHVHAAVKFITQFGWLDSLFVYSSLVIT
jgi:hypothetical protein